MEAWREDRLVAGVYGVEVDGLFFAESMFHEEDEASKLCLLEVSECLHKVGLGWFDVQMMSPHLERMGAREIPRLEFLKWLERDRVVGGFRIGGGVNVGADARI